MTATSPAPVIGFTETEVALLVEALRYRRADLDNLISLCEDMGAEWWADEVRAEVAELMAIADKLGGNGT